MEPLSLVDTSLLLLTVTGRRDGIRDMSATVCLRDDVSDPPSSSPLATAMSFIDSAPTSASASL
eukprot:scaffold82_cov134-Pinguiococcus_pyrenoidosus.AAC.1